MNKNRELLEGMQAYLNNLGKAFELTDVGGKEVLEYYYGGDESFPVDCTLSVESIGGGNTAVQIMITVFYELDEKTAACIQSLLPSLNSMLEIGCFCLIPQDGFLYMNNAFLADDLAGSSIALSLAANLEILTSTAIQARGLLLPLVKGEIQPEDVRRDDMIITQFS